MLHTKYKQSLQICATTIGVIAIILTILAQTIDLKSTAHNAFSIFLSITNDIVGNSNLLIAQSSWANLNLVYIFLTGLLIGILIHSLLQHKNELDKSTPEIETRLDLRVQDNQRDHDFFEKIKSVVTTHMADPDFNTEIVAEHLGYSARHFRRKIMDIKKCSVTSLIQEIRLETAAALLAHQEHISIKQVCEKIGIRDQKYFSKIFKEKFGCTPSEYVKKTGVYNVEHI